MTKASTTYVGLDVHKDSIDVTLAEAGAAGEVRHFGAIGGDLEAVARLLRRLQRKGRELHFVYEAGPCGFEIHRFLRAQAASCVVVSPSHAHRTNPTEHRVACIREETPRRATAAELSDGIAAGAATVRRTLANRFPGSASSPRPRLE